MLALQKQESKTLYLKQLLNTTRLKKTIIYKKNLIVGCYLIKTILHLLRIHSLQPIHQAAVLPKDGLGVNQSTKRLSNKSIKPDNPDKIFKSFS